MTAEVDLDFDSIKTNIKTYLESQSEFSDYRFDGAAMNVLVDALAYATHYNALIANMSISEAFLDSAQIRKNVVARVKDLNYFPKQISSAIASLTLTITPTVDPGVPIPIPKGSRFTTSINSESFTFVTTDDVQMVDDVTAGTYVANFAITQGVYRSQKFIKTNDPTQRFVLSQENVDATEAYFSVDVKPTDASSTSTNYTRATSLIGVDDTSEIYYIQESETGTVEIYFGDDVLGKALVNDNAVIVTYIASRGKAANNASVFTLVDNIGSYSKTEFTISNVTEASGGADEETIESIRYNAPLVNSAQDRAVTTKDYEALLRNRYPAIESLNVWGGEDNVPPQYGKVYIAVKPNYGLTISPATKADITNTILDRYSFIGITPEIVDAEYTYIDVTSTVTYDDDRTILKIGELNTSITSGITTYFTDSITEFSKDFRFSKLTSFIDGIDASIIGNNTTINLSKKFTAQTSVPLTSTLQYSTGIEAGTIASNVWIDGSSDTWQIKDDGSGLVHLYKNGSLTGTSIGTVDYSNGIVYLTNVTYTVDGSQAINLQAEPTLTDFKMTTNKILILGTTDITVEKAIL